jgi:hypothetical protein
MKFEITNKMRPYQRQVAHAVMESFAMHKGLTITVEIARQGGKNEISSQLEVLLLSAHLTQSKNLIKCSPTFKPQTVISMMRLKEKLNQGGFAGIWESEMGYIIKLGQARAIFLSADEDSNVVGNTAHLLLEVDEAQDVSEEKYTKEFKPMGSTTNVTNILYGTTWDEGTLLEKTKQINLELERKDGIQRHFRYDYEEVARYNPSYLTYVEAERTRLGENHPLFLTQYRLLPIRGGGGFLDSVQRAQLQGEHSRRRLPEAGKIYVAGIDLAGEAETGEEEYFKIAKPKVDSTVLTIGEVIYDSRFKIYESRSLNPIINPESAPSYPFINQIPFIKIVEHYAWTGVRHPELYPQMIDLLKNVWHCKSIVVDATGIGQPVASFLREALGPRVVPFTFTAPSKSAIGFNLLAAVNSGRMKMYSADNSPEYQEFWHEINQAKSYYRPSQTMNFYVGGDDGHDDYLMSLALLVAAARNYEPREARGKV